VARATSDTIRQYQLERDGKEFRLAMKTVPRPAPTAGQVLVRVRAVSLNQRDLLVMRGQYGAGGAGDMNGHVPLSDGAGEVVAVGSGTRRFKVGDRVAGIFFMRWIDGPRTGDVGASARGGGNVDGMLSEMMVAHEDSLVRIPNHLTFEEAATLPCAGVTAYRALFVEGLLKRGQFVLLEGTGGVSMFGLQFAAAAGARPIITSSSDDKLQRARQLGAAGTVNYRTNENWQREVRTLTGNAGVSHVLEVGGRDTLPKALEALAFEGHIALIGGLSGFASSVPVGQLMGLGASATGIYVGSRADFEAMNRFITEHKIRPVVDRVFPFEDAAKGLRLHGQRELLWKDCDQGQLACFATSRMSFAGSTTSGAFAGSASFLRRRTTPTNRPRVSNTGEPTLAPFRM
jgi:NADPH:quinone reductase-like Zn-dependent oxidoreductase